MYRETKILALTRNKDVLDIGSLGQSDEYCLWNTLSGNCRSLTGIDLPEAMETAKKFFSLKNHAHQNEPHLIYGNMESIDLQKRFDVVIAGDVIEHVSNQGLFLDNIYSHLRDSGKLVITTPNAKWPTVFCKPNPTHTMWHDLYTLTTILNRHNFKVDFFHFYYGNKNHYSWWKRPLVFKQSIFVIAMKA
jgi:2-polyprenyl-3-methyl-5-hydroxy-6-metoxy-1,4-benzoquinol methylase